MPSRAFGGSPKPEALSHARDDDAMAHGRQARGYSRDHRPDTLQVLAALVVTAEGFPVAYEVFDGDTADVTTLEEIVDKIENKVRNEGSGVGV